MRTIILMSTYQGENFVVDQIASILACMQQGDQLLIRDDGSTDRTIERIQSFDDSRIQCVKGQNLGFSRSFMELMRQVPSGFDMIMLADQDDIWLPGKMESAWDFIKLHKGVPALYCSRQYLVDENLQAIALSENFKRRPSFENALTENIVTGCTAAFNPDLLRLVILLKNSQLVYFHDWWLYLVATTFGNVFFDTHSHIQYRQHSQNAIGRGAGMARYLEIIKFLRKKSWIHIMYQQIQAFQLTYSEILSDEQSKFIKRFFNPNDRRSVIRLIFSMKRFRQSLFGEFLLRGLLAFEWTFGRGLLPTSPPHIGSSS